MSGTAPPSAAPSRPILSGAARTRAERAMTLAELLPVLQMAIAPAALVSGVGLLLLCMSQRFATVVDRTRSVAHAVASSPGSSSAAARRQLALLVRRAWLLRGGVGAAGASVALTVLLMIVLVAGTLAGVDVAPAAIGLLLAGLLTLLVSLCLFLRDVTLSLNALWVDLPPGSLLPTEARPIPRRRRRVWEPVEA